MLVTEIPHCWDGKWGVGGINGGKTLRHTIFLLWPTSSAVKAFTHRLSTFILGLSQVLESKNHLLQNGGTCLFSLCNTVPDTRSVFTWRPTSAETEGGWEGSKFPIIKNHFILLAPENGRMMSVGRMELELLSLMLHFIKLLFTGCVYCPLCESTCVVKCYNLDQFCNCVEQAVMCAMHSSNYL